MGATTSYYPGKLFIGILLGPDAEIGEVQAALHDRFGALDYLAGPLAFDYTEYYTREMGKPLERYFASAAGLADPEALSEAKLASNDLEQRLARPDGKRRVNLDPGLLSLSSLILATTKAQAHRIPLRDGIYGELTLLLHRNRTEALPWTYPDYAGHEYAEIILEMRRRLKDEIAG